MIRYACACGNEQKPTPNFNSIKCIIILIIIIICITYKCTRPMHPGIILKFTGLRPMNFNNRL